MPAIGRSSWFVTDESHRFGSGWISGTIGAVLGLAGAFAAACLVWPHVLTLPALRGRWPTATPAVIAGALALAFPLGALSLLLRTKKTLGAVAVGSALAGGALLAFVPRTAGAATPAGLG